MSNDRMELKCSICGKSRFLSLEEADDDGWTVSNIADGLCCPKCSEIKCGVYDYHIPTSQEALQQWREKTYGRPIITDHGTGVYDMS